MKDVFRSVVGEFLDLLINKKILYLSVAELAFVTLIEEGEQSAGKQHQYQNIKADVSRSVALRFQ